MHQWAWSVPAYSLGQWFWLLTLFLLFFSSHFLTSPAISCSCSLIGHVLSDCPHIFQPPIYHSLWSLYHILDLDQILVNMLVTHVSWHPLLFPTLRPFKVAFVLLISAMAWVTRFHIACLLWLIPDLPIPPSGDSVPVFRLPWYSQTFPGLQSLHPSPHCLPHDVSWCWYRCTKLSPYYMSGIIFVFEF